MSESSERRFRLGEVAFLLGVIVTFLVIAGILLQGFLQAD